MIKNTTEDTSSNQHLEDQSQTSQNQQQDEQLCQIPEGNVLNQTITQLEQNKRQKVEEFQHFEQLDWRGCDMISCPLCDEQMPKKYYYNHISLCQEQIGNFNLIEQECSQCHETIVKLYLKDHLAICRYNFQIYMKCPYCYLSIIKACLQQHITQCNIFQEQQQKEIQGIKICAICLEDIIENKTDLECSHSFHKDCIKNWLEQQNSCPICKRLTNEGMITN